jgi:hypothetical protein
MRMFNGSDTERHAAYGGNSPVSDRSVAPSRLQAEGGR